MCWLILFYYLFVCNHYEDHDHHYIVAAIIVTIAFFPQNVFIYFSWLSKSYHSFII